MRPIIWLCITKWIVALRLASYTAGMHFGDCLSEFHDDRHAILTGMCVSCKPSSLHVCIAEVYLGTAILWGAKCDKMPMTYVTLSLLYWTSSIISDISDMIMNTSEGKWKTRKAGTGTGTGTGTEIRKRSSDAHMYNIIPP